MARTLAPLMLGTADLSNYVSEPVKLSKTRREEINGVIKQIEESFLNVEELPLNLLRIEREQYPYLDTSFLSMSNILNHTGQDIHVPRFSVYKRSGQRRGFGDFSIKYVLVRCNIAGIDINIGEDTAERRHIFKDYLVRSTEFYKELEKFRNDYTYYDYTIKFSSDNLTRKYHKNKKMRRLEFESEFNGIIPTETKRKLKTAEEIFEDDLYLIAETKPEEWNTKRRRLVRDPLLVGVYDNKCYLIDHFNCTPMENYIKREFTS